MDEPPAGDPLPRAVVGPASPATLGGGGLAAEGGGAGGNAGGDSAAAGVPAAGVPVACGPAADAPAAGGAVGGVEDSGGEGRSVAGRAGASATGDELPLKCAQAVKQTRTSNPTPAVRGIDNSRGFDCIGVQRYHDFLLVDLRVQPVPIFDLQAIAEQIDDPRLEACTSTFGQPGLLFRRTDEECPIPRGKNPRLGKLRSGKYFVIHVAGGKHTYVVHSEASDEITIDADVGGARFTHPKLGQILFFDPTDALTPLGRLSGALQANYGMLVTPEDWHVLAQGYLPIRMSHMLHLWLPEGVMKMAAVQTMDPPNVSGVALGLLRNRGSKRWSGGDPFAVRRWIERQLADVGGGAKEMSGIELHREIEAGIPGRAIPTLLTALDITKEEFSDILGRSRKTLNELLQRQRLSRADSDLLYRVSRALVHAVSVFEDTGYAVQWLKEPNEALGGARPLNLLATVEGDEVVHAELGAIEHGLPV